MFLLALLKFQAGATVPHVKKVSLEPAAFAQMCTPPCVLNEPIAIKFMLTSVRQQTLLQYLGLETIDPLWQHSMGPIQERRATLPALTCEKMRTLWPSSLSFFSIFWSSVSFPDDLTNWLPSYEPLGKTGASYKREAPTSETTTTRAALQENISTCSRTTAATGKR